MDAIDCYSHLFSLSSEHYCTNLWFNKENLQFISRFYRASSKLIQCFSHAGLDFEKAIDLEWLFLFWILFTVFSLSSITRYFLTGVKGPHSHHFGRGYKFDFYPIKNQQKASLSFRLEEKQTNKQKQTPETKKETKYQTKTSLSQFTVSTITSN